MSFSALLQVPGDVGQAHPPPTLYLVCSTEVKEGGKEIQVLQILFPGFNDTPVLLFLQAMKVLSKKKLLKQYGFPRRYLHRSELGLKLQGMLYLRSWGGGNRAKEFVNIGERERDYQDCCNHHAERKAARNTHL